MTNLLLFVAARAGGALNAVAGARRVKAPIIRACVIIIAWSMTIYFFVR